MSRQKKIVEMKTLLAGRYKFTVRKGSDLSVVSESGWMDNLITNLGLDQIGGYNIGAFANELYVTCSVGTGTTPPANGNTALVALVATANDISSTKSFVEGTPAYWRHVRVYRFTTGAAAGNLSEVGTGDSATELFSRALIVDSGGNPTTITVLSDEVLDVTYEVRSYLDKSDQNLTWTISGVDYAVVLRLALIGTPPLIERGICGDNTYSISQMSIAGNDVLGTVYQNPTMTGADNDDGTFASYSVNNYYVDSTFHFGLSAGNFTGGIGVALITTTQTRYQMSFTPNIPKTFFNVLDMVFRFSWGRYP